MSPANQQQQKPQLQQNQGGHQNQREDKTIIATMNAASKEPSESGKSTMGETTTGEAEPLCPVNFMSKFRDKDTRVLKNLNSSQFIEVWNNYDKDGE